MGTRFASISGRLLYQHRQKLIQFVVRHAHETRFCYLFGGFLEMFRRTPPSLLKEGIPGSTRSLGSQDFNFLRLILFVLLYIVLTICLVIG